MATDENNAIENFATFADRLFGLDYRDIVDRDPHRTRADREAEVGRQLAFLRDRYDGLHITSSITDATGRVFDCVAGEDQPALRRSGGRLALPRDMPVEKATLRRPARSAFREEIPEGCVPIRRITPEQLLRHRHPGNLLRKSRGPSSAAPQAPDAASGDPTHRYAYGQQTTRALGVRTVLNVWQPVLNDQETFSLSQLWVTGGAPDRRQTLEAGWQVFPGLNHSAAPAFFTFWTPNNYSQSGPGAYDDTANFVRHPGAVWSPGVAFSDVSELGGGQIELEVGFLLHEGNWWLYAGGTEAADAVGYFPASLFGAGDLATAASVIEFGGETCSATSSPRMGSGRFADAGPTFAAYQRNVTYFDDALTPQAADLQFIADDPSLYGILGDDSAGWDSAFRYGGPGSDGAP